MCWCKKAVLLTSGGPEPGCGRARALIVTKQLTRMPLLDPVLATWQDAPLNALFS